MTEQLEDEVRSMLRQKAASVRVPAGDAGLDAINAKLAEPPATAGPAPSRRPRAPWLAAAAAAVVVAVVGASLVTQEDPGRDRTVVAAGEGTGASLASDGFEAVWPSSDIDGVRANTSSWASDADPRRGAIAYLEERFDGAYEPPVEVDVHESDADVTVVLGEISVLMRRVDGDGPWYVVRSSSESLDVDIDFDGTSLDATVVPSRDGQLWLDVRCADDSCGSGGNVDAVAGRREQLVSGPVEEPTILQAAFESEPFAIHEQLVLPSPPATAPTLDAIWPTDDPEELRGISAAWARDESPLAAAKLFLESRFQSVPADEMLVVDGQTVRVTEEHDTVVHLERLDGEIWYVQRATSDRLEVDVTYDGERVVGQVVSTTGGEINVEVEAESGAGAGSSWQSTPDDPVEIDLGFDSGGAPVAIRTKLFGDVGVVGYEERRFLAPPDAPSPPPDAPEPPMVGVWPKPADQIADDDLVDPVDTARLYLMATADVDDSDVQLSSFRQGDSNSGEVEVTGAIDATIALRRIEDRWHIEAVHTPLVEARGEVPGELWLHATVEGILDVTVLDQWGSVVQSMPDRRMGEGEEVVVVPAEPVHKPFTVRYRFDPIVGNPAGIGDVAVVGNHQDAVTPVDDVHEVPDAAIFAAGGLDPLGTAQGYIEARLGFWPDGMVLNRGSSGEDDATVDWPSGRVLLVRHDGYWYVTESTSASVAIDDVTVRDDGVRVLFTTQEPGVVQTQVLDAEGGVCAEASTDMNGGGTSDVTLGDVPCDPESVVVVLNETVAERAP